VSLKQHTRRSELVESNLNFGI